MIVVRLDVFDEANETFMQNDFRILWFLVEKLSALNPLVSGKIFFAQL